MHIHLHTLCPPNSLAKMGTSTLRRESRCPGISSCYLPHLCHPRHCEWTWIPCFRLNCVNLLGVRCEAILKWYADRYTYTGVHLPAPFPPFPLYSAEAVPTIPLESGASFMPAATRLLGTFGSRYYNLARCLEAIHLSSGKCRETRCVPNSPGERRHEQISPRQWRAHDFCSLSLPKNQTLDYRAPTPKIKNLPTPPQHTRKLDKK